MPRPVVPTSIPGDIAPSTPAPRPPILKDSPPLGFGAGNNAGFEKISNISNFFTEIYKFLPPAEVALYSGENINILTDVQKAWWEGRDPVSNNVVKGFEANTLTERSNSENELRAGTRGYMRTDWLSVPINNNGGRTGPYHNSNGASGTGRHYGHWHRMTNFSDNPDEAEGIFGLGEGKYYEQTWNSHAGVGENVESRWLHASQEKTISAMAEMTQAEDNFQTILAAMGKGEWDHMNAVMDRIGERINGMKSRGEGYATGTTAVTASEAKLFGQAAKLEMETKAKDGEGKDVTYKRRFDANYLETIESGAFRTFSDEEAYYFLVSMTESFFRFFKGFREIVGRIEDLPSTFDKEWSLDPNFVLTNNSGRRGVTTGSPNARLVENIFSMFNSFFASGISNMDKQSGDVNPEYFSLIQQFIKPMHSFSNIMNLLAGSSDMSYSGEGDRFTNFKTFMSTAAQRYLMSDTQNDYRYNGQPITRYERYLLDVGAEDYRALSRLYLGAGGDANNLPQVLAAADGFGSTAIQSTTTRPNGAVNLLLNRSQVTPGGGVANQSFVDAQGRASSRAVFTISGTRENGSSYTYSFASKEEVLAAVNKIKANIAQYWRFSPYNSYMGSITGWGTNTGGSGDDSCMLGNGLIFDDISSRGAAQIEMEGRDYSKSGLAAVGSGQFIGAFDGSPYWKAGANVQVGEERLSAMNTVKDGVYNPLYQWGKSIQQNLGVDGYITMDKLPTTRYGPGFDNSWGESRSIDSYLAPVDQARAGWSDINVLSTSRSMFQNYIIQHSTSGGVMNSTWTGAGSQLAGSQGYRAAGSGFKGTYYSDWNTKANPLYGREWMVTLFAYLAESKKEGLRRFSHTLLNNIQENRRYNAEQDTYFETIIEEITQESDLRRAEQKSKGESQKLQALIQASAQRSAAESRNLAARANSKSKKK